MPPQVIMFDPPLAVDHFCGGIYLCPRMLSVRRTSRSHVGVGLVWSQGWWRRRRSRRHSQARIRIVMPCGVHPPRGNRDYVLKFIPPHRAIYLTHRTNSDHIAIGEGNNVLIRVCSFAQPVSWAPSVHEHAAHSVARVSVQNW